MPKMTSIYNKIKYSFSPPRGDRCRVVFESLWKWSGDQLIYPPDHNIPFEMIPLN